MKNENITKNIRHLMCIMFICIVSANAKDEDIVNVPPLKEVVTMDGRLRDDEWRDAAQFLCNETTGSPANPIESGGISKTVGLSKWYLKYDEGGLYVGVVCFEKNHDYPQAFPRDPSLDDLTLDDSVQFVVGLLDRHELKPEIMNMGGYHGATGTKAAKASSYYQYTVNALGITARAYNETPLERAGFESRVSQTEEGWSVEMYIPFSSCGLIPEAGSVYFMNMFRFRPPEMIAWRLKSGFGGYHPMPFGRMKFLTADEVDEKTLEHLNTSRDWDDSSKAELKINAEIGYYPLSGAITAKVFQNGEGKESVIDFSVSGLGTKTEVWSGEKEQLLVFEVEKGIQPERNATVVVRDENNKIIFRTERKLQGVESLPEWFNTSAGIEYQNDKIPSPWKKPVIREKSVELIDKTLRFGRFGLPESISDTHGDLLAGASEIIVELNGEQLAFEDDELDVNHYGSNVMINSISSSDKLQVETKSLLDFDGFMVVKLRLLGEHVQDVSRLALRIPLKSKYAKFSYHARWQDVKRLTKYGYESKADPVWVGCESRGLSFNYDISPFLSSNTRRQIRISGDDNKRWLELNFIDAANQMENEDHVFCFFIQPTPTKPISLEKIHPRVSWKWERWSDFQGYPDLSKVPELKKWSDELHSKNQIATLYTCQGLQENSPGFTQYSEDFLGLPKWQFYQRNGIPAFYTCKRGPEGDLQLWAFEKLANQGGIDGIISDGMSIPWDCDNPGHKYGCGRQQIIEWEHPVRTKTIETRSFLKRMRGIFSETGRPFNMTAHTGGSINLNTLSFFDGYMEGESISRYRAGYRIPLHVFAAGFNSYPWGFRTIFWEKHWRRKTRGYFWSLTYALLHDGEIEDTAYPNILYRGFTDNAETEYYPYWGNSPHVELKSNNCLMSYYLKENETLVVVGNMGYETDHFELDLQKLFPGYSLRGKELLSGRKMELNDFVYSDCLEGYKCMVLHLVRCEKDSDWNVEGYNEDEWALAGGNRGVQLSKINPASDSAGVRMSSVAYKDAGTLAFIAHKFKPAGYAKLRLTHSGRFGLVLGKARLFWDSGKWQSSGFAVQDNYKPGSGILFNPEVQKNKPVMLEVSLERGLLNVAYNGEPLARNLPLSEVAEELHVQVWGGDEVILEPIKLSAEPKKIYAGGITCMYLNSTNAPPVFSIEKQNINDWTFSAQRQDALKKHETMLENGLRAIRLVAQQGQPAPRATCKHSVGRDAMIVLRFKMDRRFRVNIGPVELVHDNGWDIEGPLAGWSEGVGYWSNWHARSGDWSVDTNKELHLLAISISNGSMSVMVDGSMLMKDVEFDLPPSGNQIGISTWHNDEVIFRVEEISTNPIPLFEKGTTHPIQ